MCGGASGGAVAVEEQRRGSRQHVTRSPSHSATVLTEWVSQRVSDSCIATALPVVHRSRWTTCEPDPAPLKLRELPSCIFAYHQLVTSEPPGSTIQFSVICASVAKSTHMTSTPCCRCQPSPHEQRRFYHILENDWRSSPTWKFGEW